MEKKAEGLGEKEFRNQVSWMMFLLSILVVWVHSYNVDLFRGGASGAAWEQAARAEHFLSVQLGQAAVPGFFMLSSYLFFRNFVWKNLCGKLRRRIGSIVIPYVVWNTIYYLGYVAAARIPVINGIVGKAPAPFGIKELMYAIFRYRYAPIFWYLFQLIILIFISPVIYGLVKHKWLGILYLCMLLAGIYLGFDTQMPNTDALFYYSAAAFMAVHGTAWAERKWSCRRFFSGMALFTAAAICLYQMEQPGAPVLWTIGTRFFTPAAIWQLLPGEYLFEARPWMKLSMFLYAIHYIVVRFVNKGTALILVRALPERSLPLAALAVYLILPMLTVAAAYGVAQVLRRYAPAVWRILSGGRDLT